MPIRLFSENFAEVALPVRTTDFEVLPPNLDRIQFDRPLLLDDYNAISDWLADHPKTSLRIYGDYQHAFEDFSFLSCFQRIRRIAIDIYHWSDFESLKYLPDDLESLSIGDLYSRRFSVEMIARFTQLRDLSIAGPVKSPQTIAQFLKVRTLGLHGGALKELALLARLPELRSLFLTGGKVDCSPIMKLSHLEHLFLGRISACTDLDFLAGLNQLKSLDVNWLPKVSRLPDCSGHLELRRVRFETMKGLVDSTGLLAAPNLESIEFLNCPLLDAASHRAVIHHPSASIKLALPARGGKETP